MAINFYLEIEGQRHVLPLVPGEITVDVPSKNETTEVVQLGEITQMAQKGLRSISFDCFFPFDHSIPYVLKEGSKKQPSEWVEMLEKVLDDRKPIRLVITDTKINMLVSMDDFSWEMKDSTGDIYYSLKLKEFKNYSAKMVQTDSNVVSRQPERPAATNEPITVGCKVIVNGRLHRDSSGAAPGQTESNATRQVNFIQSGAKFPYHVATLEGGWRGWVSADSVKRVSG